MIRILNAESSGYCAEARAVLASLGDLVEEDLDRAELLSRIAHFDVLLVRLRHQIDQEVLDAGSRLKAICTATTGLDHIDVERARRRGIRVLSLKGETAFLDSVSATAEHTWALLLALTRRIPQAFASVRAGAWDRDAFKGRELKERSLGLVGLGRLGRKVARYGLAFDMKVQAYDPHAEVWLDDVRRVGSLAELLQDSDIVSLHATLDASTVGLIGARELTVMRPGAVLINTSRGDLVDEDALVGALTSGHLGGAAVDVIAHERHLERRRRSPLLAYASRHENLLVTPHIGGATSESMAKTELFLAGQLDSFVRALQARASASTRVEIGRS